MLVSSPGAPLGACPHAPFRQPSSCACICMSPSSSQSTLVVAVGESSLVLQPWPSTPLTLPPRKLTVPFPITCVGAADSLPNGEMGCVIIGGVHPNLPGESVRGLFASDGLVAALDPSETRVIWRTRLSVGPPIAFAGPVTLTDVPHARNAGKSVSVLIVGGTRGWAAVCAGSGAELAWAPSSASVTALAATPAVLACGGAFVAVGSADGSIRMFHLMSSPPSHFPPAVTAAAPGGFVPPRLLPPPTLLWEVLQPAAVSRLALLPPVAVTLDSSGALPVVCFGLITGSMGSYSSVASFLTTPAASAPNLIPLSAASGAAVSVLWQSLVSAATGPVLLISPTRTSRGSLTSIAPQSSNRSTSSHVSVPAVLVVWASGSAEARCPYTGAILFSLPQKLLGHEGAAAAAAASARAAGDAGMGVIDETDGCCTVSVIGSSGSTVRLSLLSPAAASTAVAAAAALADSQGSAPATRSEALHAALRRKALLLREHKALTSSLATASDALAAAEASAENASAQPDNSAKPIAAADPLTSVASVPAVTASLAMGADGYSSSATHAAEASIGGAALASASTAAGASAVVATAAAAAAAAASAAALVPPGTRLTLELSPDPSSGGLALTVAVLGSDAVISAVSLQSHALYGGRARLSMPLRPAPALRVLVPLPRRRAAADVTLVCLVGARGATESRAFGVSRTLPRWSRLALVPVFVAAAAAGIRRSAVVTALGMGVAETATLMRLGRAAAAAAAAQGQRDTWDDHRSVAPGVPVDGAAATTVNAANANMAGTDAVAGSKRATSLGSDEVKRSAVSSTSSAANAAARGGALIETEQASVARGQSVAKNMIGVSNGSNKTYVQRLSSICTSRDNDEHSMKLEQQLRTLTPQPMPSSAPVPALDHTPSRSTSPAPSLSRAPVANLSSKPTFAAETVPAPGLDPVKQTQEHSARFLAHVPSPDPARAPTPAVPRQTDPHAPAPVAAAGAVAAEIAVDSGASVVAVRMPGAQTSALLRWAQRALGIDAVALLRCAAFLERAVPTTSAVGAASVSGPALIRSVCPTGREGPVLGGELGGVLGGVLEEQEDEREYDSADDGSDTVDMNDPIITAHADTDLGSKAAAGTNPSTLSEATEAVVADDNTTAAAAAAAAATVADVNNISRTSTVNSTKSGAADADNNAADVVDVDGDVSSSVDLSDDLAELEDLELMQSRPARSRNKPGPVRNANGGGDVSKGRAEVDKATPVAGNTNVRGTCSVTASVSAEAYAQAVAHVRSLPTTPLSRLGWLSPLPPLSTAAAVAAAAAAAAAGAGAEAGAAPSVRAQAQPSPALSSSALASTALASAALSSLSARAAAVTLGLRDLETGGGVLVALGIAPSEEDDVEMVGLAENAASEGLVAAEDGSNKAKPRSSCPIQDPAFDAYDCNGVIVVATADAELAADLIADIAAELAADTPLAMLPLPPARTAADAAAPQPNARPQTPSHSQSSAKPRTKPRAQPQTAAARARLPMLVLRAQELFAELRHSAGYGGGSGDDVCDREAGEDQLRKQAVEQTDETTSAAMAAAEAATAAFAAHAAAADAAAVQDPNAVLEALQEAETATKCYTAASLRGARAGARRAALLEELGQLSELATRFRAPEDRAETEKALLAAVRAADADAFVNAVEFGARPDPSLDMNRIITALVELAAQIETVETPKPLIESTLAATATVGAGGGTAREDTFLEVTSIDV